MQDNYHSNTLLFALFIQGTGSFWFDTVTIEIDNEIVGNSSPDFREPSPEEVRLMDKQAIELTNEYTEWDTEKFSEIFEDIRIVALGENSHGSASIFKLKLQLLKYLVMNEGFDVFALEMPTVEADVINEYVLYNKGNVEQVISSLTYPSWQTQEIISIIEWIKKYNASQEVKIQFQGFDMQNGGSAFDQLQEFANEHDKDLSKKLTEINRTSDPNSIISKSGKALAHLERISYPNVSAEYLERMKHYLNIFIQSIKFQYSTEGSKNRDYYMAENINWILSTFGSESKIIVSGDNTHITKSGGKMGSFLKKEYQEKYLSIGFTYNTGTYSAMGPENSYKVHPSYPGTYEYLFSKSFYTDFLLDIREETGIPLLEERSGFRSIGSRPQETTQFFEMNIKEHFDIIIYQSKSTHTIPLNLDN